MVVQATMAATEDSNVMACCNDQSAVASKGMRLIEACGKGDEPAVASLLRSRVDPAQYDDATGASCLMLAAGQGSERAVTLLLQAGAPWNAVDRKGRCAGEYALEGGHQTVVDMIVNHAVQCELLLGAAGRNGRMRLVQPAGALGADEASPAAAPIGESAAYLARSVRYDGDRLLDEANDAVMMEWERPLMKAHAQVLCGSERDRKLLNIGFGMGIVDSHVQECGCSGHVIIEAHPAVAAKARRDGWGERASLVEGRWQDALAPGGAARALGPFDAIFYDAYAEDYEDMRELHALLPELLVAGGLYSFFNGLCPDNIFFHGVVCQLVQVRAAAAARCARAYRVQRLLLRVLRSLLIPPACSRDCS